MNTPRDVQSASNEIDQANWSDFGMQDPAAQALQAFATTGYGSAGMAGVSGAAWEGQMRSLQTDAMQHDQKGNMKNDIITHLTTSAHKMGQNGTICQAWTKVALQGVQTPSLLNLSMGDLTGNTMSGQANEFNQYWLCRLKRFKVIFKDIIVLLEASTSVGLQVMSDVITEWRRRPMMEYNKNPDGSAQTNLIPPPESEYPDWWGDWRPATDGAVEFDFEVNSGEVPVWVVQAQQSQGPRDWKDPTRYQTLGQFIYGTTYRQQFRPSGVADASAGDHGQFDIQISGPPIGVMGYHPYLAAQTKNWLDYFFEVRARNCPQSSQSANTSVGWNIQIDAEWEMKHRITTIPAGTYPSNEGALAANMFE